MARVVKLRSHRDLTTRRTITLTLPEFFLAALEHRLSEVNDGTASDEAMTLEQLVEIDLANSLSLAEVAHLERDMPGISAAVSNWLEAIE